MPTERLNADHRHDVVAAARAITLALGGEPDAIGQFSDGP
jgi:hypothetical protein